MHGVFEEMCVDAVCAEWLRVECISFKKIAEILKAVTYDICYIFINIY